MADDAVERAARARESLERAVQEVRGSGPEGSAAAQRAHDRDVNALLSRTRAVIDRTRRVIEQTKSNLQRLAGTHDDDAKAE
jgi:ABC-type transporter Mla subunit MlaD